MNGGSPSTQSARPGSAIPSCYVPFAAPPILIALVGAVWHAVARASFSPALLFWSLFAGFLFSASGVAFLSVLESQKTANTGAPSSLSAYLVGFILVSSVLLLLAFTSPFPIWLNFAMLSVACMAALLSASVRAGWKRLSFGNVEALALLLILISAGFWSQENLESITVRGPVVVSHPWQDIPFHVVQVSLFAHAQGAGQLSHPLMSGQLVPLYHYGSYMVTSLLCRVTGLDAYALTTGWYAPMGFVLVGLAAWSFGASLLGAAGGLGAVFATLLVPDPSYYWLGNRWTGYFFFQTVEIGAAYAVAIQGLAWAFFYKFLRTDARRVLLAALLLCALSAFFKATNFLVYSSALLIFGAAFARGAGRRTRLLLVGCLIADVFGLLVLRQLPGAPTLAISSSGAPLNLNQILDNFPAASVGWLRDSLHSHTGYGRQLLLGIPIILVTTYGLLVPASLAALFLSMRSHLHPAWSWFPVLMLVNHVFVALCLDSNHGIGDAYEIIHKTFVFPYFAVAAWTGATLFSRLDVCVRSGHIRRSLLVGASAVALAGVYIAGKSVQSGILWADKAMQLMVPKGLYDAAQFLRERTPAHAVVQYSEDDKVAMFPALAERKSFVVRYTDPPFAVGPEEARRVDQVETLLRLDAADSVKTMAAALGIDWLLVGDKREPAWAGQMRPVFESQGFRLYEIGVSGPESQ